MKSFSRFERSYLLLPACAAAVLCLAGCANQTELLLPEGAFTPENTRDIPADNASPAPGIGVHRPANSDTIIGTLSVPADDIAPDPVVKDKKPAVSVRRPPVKKVAADDVIYKVRKGDTLGAIAKRHKTNWRAIAQYNGLDSKARIYPGQTIRIPKVSTKAVPHPVAAKAAVKNGKFADSGKIHVVKKGEYPGMIAAKYKVRLNDLLELNNIKGKKVIYVGQKLRIPAAVPVTAKKTPVKKTAKKTVVKKPAVKKAPSKKVQPRKKAAVPVIADKKKDATGDDVLNDLDKSSSAPAGTAETAPAVSSNVSVAPVKDDRGPAFDAETVAITLNKDMTLEQVAKMYDRSLETLKKLNPHLNPGEVLKASTTIKIPIF